MVGNWLLASQYNGCNFAFVILQKQRQYFFASFQNWFTIYLSSPTSVMEGRGVILYLWDFPWLWPMYSPRSLVPLFLFWVSNIHGNGRKRCDFTRKYHLSFSFAGTKSYPWPPYPYRVGKRSGKRVVTWLSSFEAIADFGSGCTHLTEEFVWSSRSWGEILLHGCSAASR